MNEQEILQQIDALVDEEHRLRSADTDPAERRERLQQVEQTLDQCWDLLRQRRARLEAGQDPEDVKTRPVDEVEGYLQ